MVTQFTRFITGFLLIGLLCLAANQATAQKQGKPQAKPAKQGKAETPGRARSGTESRLEDAARAENQIGPSATAYYVFIPDLDKNKGVIDEISRLFGKLRITATEAPEVQVISGDPVVLARMRAAYPELFWMTSQQMAALTGALKAVPALADPDYIEKLK